MTGKGKGSPQPARDGAGLPPTICVGEGRQAVNLQTFAMGCDLLVTITGGQAHVGGVALARDGHVLGGLPGEATAALVVPGHREGPLAVECAAIISRAAGCSCVVVAGIHQDHAGAQEIEAIVGNARTGAMRLAAALAAE